MELRVCCILPHHRKEFLECAISSFDAQDYPHRRLFALDTSQISGTIGTLRNRCISEALQCGPFDLIAHWDDDDWSHPKRLSEQVELIERTKADVVAYSDLAFYDVEKNRVLFYDSNTLAYGPGTTLLYRREVWERTQFPDIMVEDTTWLHQVKRVGAIVHSESSIRDGVPRIIARIHAKNTTPKYGTVYQPASPQLDAEVRRLLA